MRARLFAAILAAFAMLAASGSRSAQVSPIEDSLGETAPLPFDAIPLEAESPFGGISLSPTHVVMQGEVPTGRITVYNTGSSTFTLSVEAVDFAANEQRHYSALAPGEDAQWSALPHLRFAPRQAVLRPGERQVVRLIARGMDASQANELRSHLQLTIDPTDATPYANVPSEPSLRDDTRLGQVKLNYAI